MRQVLGPAAAALLLCTSATASAGQPTGSFHFDLPALDLSSALRSVAARTGMNLIAPSNLVEGRQAPSLHGDYSRDGAFATLLEGSGLKFRIERDAVVIGVEVDRDAARAGREHEAVESNRILVTGTRIRGAPVASTVIKLSQEQIRDRGQATLADAIQSIPQNFGGGQNPAIGNNVPAASGVNVGSAASVNLRGLGSDATLTLINGHRLSYSASRQAIDISSIPLGALERLEIVPDGASALYGSDAVAGVVNVLLRRDFQGIETSARLGGSSGGGDFEQRYGVTAGARWGSGGIVATYEFGRTTAIDGKDRSFTADRPALTLLPAIQNHSAVVSGHQNLGAQLSFELDSLFNDRVSSSSYSLSPTGDILASGARFSYHSRSFVLAPSLKLRTRSDWNLFLTGSYAQDHTNYDVKSFFQGSVFDFPGNCYCNHAASAEIGADGTLVTGPAGPVKVAAGAGYRANKLVRFNGAGASTNISKIQDSYYAYGELSLPLVSPDQNIGLINSLSLSGAARFERYPGIGQVITPKLGLIYAPSPDLAFKGSWGKSFRAPTLYQQYQAINVVLARPGAFGGSGFPASATALLLQGGNPDLKPERATSWSASLDLHPRAIDGARLELSYFATRYKDRVVTPITFLSQALRDPSYANRLTFAPDPALLAAVIAGATSFGNAAGVPYDPSNVAVFIDDRNVNAGFQKIEGADLLLSYGASLGNLGQVHASLDATYLKSRQQLTALQPVVPLAGILFNPPHFRGRGDLSWVRGALTLNAAVTHSGGVEDRRRPTIVHVHGMTSLDLTARLRSRAKEGPLRGLDASVTVQNLLNSKPAAIATTLLNDAPYDSTNYSPVGRFIAVSVAKRW